MEKLRPLKRREIKIKGIPLDDRENVRFLEFVAHHGQLELVQRFIADTKLYLRGRWDGPTRSGAAPCGYLFLSKDSFERGHSAIAFFDAIPLGAPLNVTFRQWGKELPFDKKVWDGLRQDRMQENMRSIDLVPEPAFREAVRLATIARETFAARFDLSVSLA